MLTTSQRQAAWFDRYNAAQAELPVVTVLATGVLYSEASYFDGYHFAHIAAWEDEQRISRARKNFLRERRSHRR
jgi:hypothetical protein